MAKENPILVVIDGVRYLTTRECEERFGYRQVMWQRWARRNVVSSRRTIYGIRLIPESEAEALVMAKQRPREAIVEAVTRLRHAVSA